MRYYFTGNITGVYKNKWDSWEEEGKFLLIIENKNYCLVEISENLMNFSPIMSGEWKNIDKFKNDLWNHGDQKITNLIVDLCSGEIEEIIDENLLEKKIEELQDNIEGLQDETYLLLALQWLNDNFWYCDEYQEILSRENAKINKIVTKMYDNGDIRGYYSIEKEGREIGKIPY